MTKSGIHTEHEFESSIERSLLESGGYQKGDPKDFKPDIALDTGIFLSFIQETQPNEWEYLTKLQGDLSSRLLIDDLCRALNSPHEGCLSVLRHGFKCFGKTFQAAYFAPATSLNPEILRKYNANRLIISRQVAYSQHSSNTLDMVISLNGIPVITIELKNFGTQQNYKYAIKQYRTSRDPNEPIFQFGKRALVHFAVDTDEVWMTTKLAGTNTHFLPFNKGNNKGSGNPENPGSYRTSYFWEEILARDSILDIIGRFIHVSNEEKNFSGKKVAVKKIIFPRYHQIDAVRKLVTDVKEKGVGQNYLIQHSAGSGKSNSIAWLTHRLAGLFTEEDQKIFNSVIVITDRTVLDQQLQDTIYQFEHKQGVVQKIEKDSQQLANALENSVPIIITTLQKFPYVTKKIGELPKRHYAVIIDEAHSSQGGESAIELKKVLAMSSVREEAQAYVTENETPDYEEEIIKEMIKRGKQKNISFFAFTATPKYKTLEIFGRKKSPNDKPEPFHLYSMRQAIEEHFILDVLSNYTTYTTYYNLIKSVEDDPKVDKRKAARALARYMELHPHNIAQKTELMIEHYRHFTSHKIGGKAKAMVVTSRRIQAVKYKLEFDKYIHKKGYQDLKTLVAFSGEVEDDEFPGKKFTEVEMNGRIREKELPERFASDDFQILIVADKFQTGFDQPLLHTMYVDKRLGDIQAVQTLSRLNRIHPGKEDTFVLDFVNKPEEIKKAFQPYYEWTAVGEEVEISHLYDLIAKLDGYQIWYASEIEDFCRVFYKPKEKVSPTDQALMYSYLDPAVSRFTELDQDTQDSFRKVLIAYKNLYAFLSQIIPFYDSDLEKHYSFIRFLINKLPKKPGTPDYHPDDEVKLQYYRLQKISEGSIPLDKGLGGVIDGPTAVGTEIEKPVIIDLSELITLLNEKFGTDFTVADQLFFDSIKEDAIADTKLREAARANTLDNFEYIFSKALVDLFIDRMEQNEEITARFMSEPEFQDAVKNHLLKQVYNQIRVEG